MTIPPQPPEYINFFKPFKSWPVNHLVVPIGVSHISLRHKKYNWGSGRKRTNEQYGLGLTQVQEGQVCDTAFPVHLQTNADSILHKISTKPRGILTHLDWSSLTAPGPYLMPTGLFWYSVSTASLRLPSPTAFSEFIFTTPSRLSRTCLSYHTSGLIQDLESKPFVWLHAKTDKRIVCLVDHLVSQCLYLFYI